MALTHQEKFIRDVAILDKGGLAQVSNRLMDSIMREPDEAKRGELSRRLLVIDAIADLKFPGEFASARRRAA